MLLLGYRVLLVLMAFPYDIGYHNQQGLPNTLRFEGNSYQKPDPQMPGGWTRTDPIV